MNDALGNGTAPKVFLGYSHADKAIADEVRAGLEECGLQVWSDDDLHPGQSLSATIASAIHLADVFVMLLSASSGRSQWASLEVGGAIASNKRLIPVRIAHDADVPFMLRDRRFIDAADPSTRADAVHELCDAIRDSHDSRTDLRGGVELARLALANLELERAFYESERTLSQHRWGVFVSASFCASAAGLVSLFGRSNLATALAVVGVTLLASRVGFQYGADRWRAIHDRRSVAGDS